MVSATVEALESVRAVKIRFAGSYLARAWAVAAPSPLGLTPVMRTICVKRQLI